MLSGNFTGFNQIPKNRVNRGQDTVLQQVEDLRQGDFEDINAVIPNANHAAQPEKCKSRRFSIETQNTKPPTIG